MDPFEEPDWLTDWLTGRPEERPDYVEPEETETENPFTELPEETADGNH